MTVDEAWIGSGETWTATGRAVSRTGSDTRGGGGAPVGAVEAGAAAEAGAQAGVAAGAEDAPEVRRRVGDERRKEVGKNSEQEKWMKERFKGMYSG